MTTESDITSRVIVLWETAQSDSDIGRFHDATMGFEKAKNILNAEGTSGSDKLDHIVQELKHRVEVELRDHFLLFGGNYFLTLGVQSNCRPKEIRKAYRAFVLHYHPDKNIGIDTRALFQAGQTAYEVLSDETRRLHYKPSILPGQWLGRRAEETRRLAAIESKRRQENPTANPMKPRQAESNAEKGAETPSTEDNDAAAGRASSERSARTKPKPTPPAHKYVWLYPSELRALKMGELLSELRAVGLGRLADGSEGAHERKELELAYLNTRRTALALGGGRAAAYAAYSSSRPKPPSSSSRAEAPSSPRKSSATDSTASRPNEGAASFGGRMTKEDIHRYEERMFGRRPEPSQGVGSQRRSGCKGEGDSKSEESKSTRGSSPSTSCAEQKSSSEAATTLNSGSKDERQTETANSVNIEQEVHWVAPPTGWGRPKNAVDDSDEDEEEGSENDGEKGEENSSSKDDDYECRDFPTPFWGRPKVYDQEASDDDDDDDDEDDNDDDLEDWNFVFDVTSIDWDSISSNGAAHQKETRADFEASESPASRLQSCEVTHSDSAPPKDVGSLGIYWGGVAGGTGAVDETSAQGFTT